MMSDNFEGFTDTDSEPVVRSTGSQIQYREPLP